MIKEMIIFQIRFISSFGDESVSTGRVFNRHENLPDISGIPGKFPSKSVVFEFNVNLE